jgi:hypothetical protein
LTRKAISQWCQYLYFLRFSLLAWSFLIVLVLFDRFTPAAALTRGIMTVESGWQAFFAAFFVVGLQMTALVTARNIVKNGEDRFLSTPPSFLHTRLTDTNATTMWRVLGAAHIPTYFALIYLGYNASWREQQTFKLFRESTHYVWIFLALGVAAAILFWYLVSLFYMWTYKPNGNVPPAALIFPGKLFGDTAEAIRPPRIKLFESFVLHFLSKSYSGYAANAEGPLWELHFLSALALIGFFLLYLLLYPFTAPIFQLRPFSLPLVLLLLIVAALVWMVWNADTTGSKWAPIVKSMFGAILVAVLVLYGSGIAYGWGIFRNATSVNRPNVLEMAFPTLASILVIATFTLWLFAGLGFFLDRYRIPVLSILLAGFLLPIHWSKAEHYYSVEPLSGPAFPPSPAEVLQYRSNNLDQPDIIVTAAGGGIHAAAWTAQVLSRLETAFANDQALKSKSYTFHDHIILASGVSGGSVGLMPFLLEYAATDESSFKDLTNSQFHARITNPGSCSSLEAVAWGLEYHDLYRLLFQIIPQRTKSEAFDRSWALSAAFRRNLHDPHCFDGGLPPPVDRGRDALTLSKASDLLRLRKMPAFTFNTTAAETGDRFLLSNYAVPPPKSEKSDFVPAQSFLQVYAQGSSSKILKAYADLHLATAARLSATFPYVSSASRLPVDYADHAYHFLDGGYFDSDGTASVIEFLKSALDESRVTSKTSGTPQALTGHRRRVLLIEIRDGGDLDSQSDDDLSHQNTNGNSQWTVLTQLIAPPSGLWKAGHNGISRRNRREICFLETSYRQEVNIHHLVFPINTPTSRAQPLSWNLTANQRKDVNTWANNSETGERIEEAVRWVKAALSGEITDADSDADICKTAEVPDATKK